MSAAQYTICAICPVCGTPVKLKGRRILTHSRSVQGYRSLHRCGGTAAKAADADVLAWLKREQEGIANARSYTADRIAEAEQSLAAFRSMHAETEARAKWIAAQFAAIGGES